MRVSRPGGSLGSLKRWVRSRVAGSEGPEQPRLSVVVPVYNVEEYLAECLDSVLAQPYDDVEVVLVDDGSTDSSGEIARRYAEAHDNFRLVSQTNGGLGAARNTGVEHARGEYLTFLDSDDRLPPDAWSSMMAALEESGSDLACGVLVRDTGEDGGGGQGPQGPRVPRVKARRMRENHRVRRLGITLEDQPLILADVFAVNKIYRRAFWDRAGLEFPTRIRYEDQPTLTRAFLAAESFDVVTETVYLWRVRDDGSSITQRRDDIDDLRERLVTKRWSTESVTEQAPHLRDLWLADVLPADMFEYFRVVPGCSDEYWDLLVSMVREFWSDDTVPFHETVVPVQQRLLGWYVAHGRRDDVVRLMGFLEEHRADLPVEQRGDRVVALLPGIDERGLPESTYTLAEHETRFEARVIEAAWDGSRLDLRGFALVRNAPTAGKETTLTARLVAADGRSMEVALEPERQPRATRLVNRPSQDFDDCGFSVSVDVAALGGTTTWRLDLERTVDGLQRSGGLTGFDRRQVDRSWHDLPGGADSGVVGRARLREDGDGLALVVESA